MCAYPEGAVEFMTSIVKVCTDCADPVRTRSCDPPLVDYSYAETVWCVAGKPYTRIDSFRDGLFMASTWYDRSSVVAVLDPNDVAQGTPGACPALDAEFTERLVCSGGVTIVRSERTLTDVTSGSVLSTTVNWFGVNGAPVAAPAVFTEGACDDQDIEAVSELVCAAGVTLVRRRILDGGTGALVSELFVSSNGVTVAAPAVYTQGACATSVLRDVEVDQVCATGVTVQRVRMFDLAANPPTVLSTQFFGVNGVTVAAPPVFTHGACSANSAAVAETVAVFKCGATANATVATNATALRVALSDDIVFTKACPTTASISNSLLTVATNSFVTGGGAIPLNARSVTVYNVTAARIGVSIASYGSVMVPPNGTWSLNLPDNVPPFVGPWAVVNSAGSSGLLVGGIQPHVILDWVVRA